MFRTEKILVLSSFVFAVGCSAPSVPTPEEGGSGDSGPDATVESGPEAAVESGLEAAAESGLEAALEAAVESGRDTGSGETGTGEGGPGCLAGQLACDGGCVADDPHNCGACGHDCNNLPNVSGQVLCGAGGACEFDAGACAPGYAHCGGGTDRGCETPIDTMTNCGACGTVCSGSAPYCGGSGQAYSCTSGCMGSTPTPCGTSCVDTTSDSQNCKTCGNACATTVANATATCVNGACSFSCKPGYSPCAGGCANFSGDGNNCGACGNACGPGATCSGGACVCNTGTGCNGCCNGNKCETAVSASSCGKGGATCAACPISSEVCASVATGGVCQCPTGDTQCGSACVNTQTDSSNCGTCATSCASVSGSSCSGGHCTCPSGTQNCSGTCVNVSGTDANNCGSCGHSCLSQAGGTCSAGVCQPAVLVAADVKGLATDGTTVYWTTSTGAATVQSCLGTGCAMTPTNINTEPGIPGQIVAAGGSIYWIQQFPASHGVKPTDILGCPPGNCSSQAFLTSTTTDTMYALATDGQNAYWSGSSELQTCNLVNCTAMNYAAATANSPYEIASAGSGLFWTDATTGNLMGCSATGTGCSSPITISPALDSPTVVAVDGKNVYWSDALGVKQCPVTGCGGNAPLALASGQQNANSIATDGTYVYWTNGSSVVRARVGVGNSGTPVALNQTGSATIAIGSKAIYWSTTTSAIMLLAK